MVAQGVQGIDGIAAGPSGSIHGVNAAANLAGVPPVFTIDPRAGTVTPITLDAADFDAPTSLVMGRGNQSRRSAFVLNSDLFLDPVGAGAGVVEVGVR